MALIGTRDPVWGLRCACGIAQVTCSPSTRIQWDKRVSWSFTKVIRWVLVFDGGESNVRDAQDEFLEQVEQTRGGPRGILFSTGVGDNCVRSMITLHFDSRCILRMYNGFIPVLIKTMRTPLLPSLSLQFIYHSVLWPKVMRTMPYTENARLPTSMV